MLKRQRDGIAKAQREGRCKGCAPSVPAVGCRDRHRQGGRREAVRDRDSAGDRHGERVPCAWDAFWCGSGRDLTATWHTGRAAVGAWLTAPDVFGGVCSARCVRTASSFLVGRSAQISPGSGVSGSVTTDCPITTRMFMLSPAETSLLRRGVTD